MDIGLSKFLEKFEERFGRGATTVLLATIGAAIMAGGFKLIWENVLDPLRKALVGQATTVDIMNGLATMIIMLLILILATWIMHRIDMQKSADKFHKIMVDRANEERELQHKAYDEMFKACTLLAQVDPQKAETFKNIIESDKVLLDQEFDQMIETFSAIGERRRDRIKKWPEENT